MIVSRRRYRVDNYLYLLTEGDDAALVDPGDPAVALALASSQGVRPRFVLHTHGHADHTGGTAAVARELGAAVHGRGPDGWSRAPDVDVHGREELRLGALRVEVLPAPGHTPGSVLFRAGEHLFTGDTLFWGGAGNCKSGDPAALAETFLGVLSALDGALLVQPGHDYGEQNLRFALELTPHHAGVRSRLAALEAARDRGEEPAPSTLAEERATNPFLRAGALRPTLAARGLHASGEREAFVTLRRLKDGWRDPGRQASAVPSAGEGERR